MCGGQIQHLSLFVTRKSPNLTSENGRLMILFVTRVHYVQWPQVDKRLQICLTAAGLRQLKWEQSI